MNRFLLTLIGLSFALAGYTQDARIKIIPWQENQVVTIHGRTFTTTQLVFGVDEIVQGVEGGDSAGWIVDFKEAMPNMVFLKPTVFDSNSNLTVVTNKHSYYFKIRSNSSLTTAEDKATYAIRFTYPQDARDELNARLKANALKHVLVSPGAPINWQYEFAGQARLRPRQVFDDGRFTYIEFSDQQAIPAVFAVDNRDGREALVNTRRKGNFLVIQRLSPQLTLRLGNEVASVFNSPAILRLREGRG